MPTSDQLKALGNDAFANKQYKKAAKIYRDAIDMTPTPVLYSNRAQCFIYLKDWDRALLDTKLGLSTDGDLNITVKLLYRQAVVYENISDITLAKVALKTALKIDPNNIQVLTMLKRLNALNGDGKENANTGTTIKNKNMENTNNVNKKKKLDKPVNNSTEIPVENVTYLPEYFESILKPSFKESSLNEHMNSIKISEIASDEINQLFSKESKTTPQPNEETSQNDIPFTDRSAMHHLSALSTVPQSQKISAYKYILNNSPEYFKDLFASAGLDAEFLAFFIEAASFASTHENTIDNWQNTVLNHIVNLSKLKRYELCLLFCSQSDIKNLLQNVGKLNDESILQQYNELLH